MLLLLMPMMILKSLTKMPVMVMRYHNAAVYPHTYESDNVA
jgi:hypothetical protein